MSSEASAVNVPLPETNSTREVNIRPVVQTAAPTQTLPGSAAVAIGVDKLSAYYGSFKAIEDVTLDFYDKEVTAIIGPSGCGKSTLLRCLNRMHEVIPGAHADGGVLLDGKNIYDKDMNPVLLRRRVGMVFQRPNPFPSMSIYENVASGLRLAGRVPKGVMDEVVETSLRAAALWDEVKDKLSQGGLSLSGGQQQRLCIARTIAVQPDVVLMDEPASALDPVSTLKIEDLMRELKAHYTIIIVTHNLQQAARISDRTAFMLGNEDRKGRLVEYAPTSEFFTTPKDTRTEQYITGRFG